MEAWYVCLRPLGVVRREVRPPLVAAPLAVPLDTPPGLVPTPGMVCLSTLAWYCCRRRHFWRWVQAPATSAAANNSRMAPPTAMQPMRMPWGPAARRLAAARAAGAGAVPGAAAGPMAASPVNAKLASAACWASMPAGAPLGGGVHHVEGKEYGQGTRHDCVWCMGGGVHTSEVRLSMDRTAGPTECGRRKAQGTGGARHQVCGAFQHCNCGALGA